MSVPLQTTALALFTAFTIASHAQARPPIVPVPPSIHPAPGVDYRSDASLQALAATLVTASAATGIASVTLDKTPTHFTMLTVRAKSGGAELHKKASDMFVAMDGEATIVTGGTIADLQVNGDEEKGSHIEGGVPQIMHKGDVILIAPTPLTRPIIAPRQDLHLLRRQSSHAINLNKPPRGKS